MLTQSKQKALHSLPVVPHPCAPYGAQGWDSYALIWHDQHSQPVCRFRNGFKTPLSVVDWSHDGSILLAGSTTGEVLAWEFATGERLLDNRHTHSYAPIVGLSWSPGGRHLVAITLASTIQIWNVATRTCLVLPCRADTEEIKWRLDGSGFRTNNSVVWSEPNKLEGGR